MFNLLIPCARPPCVKSNVCSTDVDIIVGGSGVIASFSDGSDFRAEKRGRSPKSVTLPRNVGNVVKESNDASTGCIG